MKKLKFYTCFLVLLAFAQTSSAQATLSVQGTVQKSTGAAVDDGDYSLTFRLYTTETGGTPVWSETQDPVNIIGGVYSVTLGSITPLTAAFDQTYYLGVKVGTGTELTPRARLTSSPYALSLIGQDNIFPSTGAVGTGTATPSAGYQLHVKSAAGDGKLLVEGSTGSEIQFKKGANMASITYDGTNISIQNLNLVFDSGISLPAGQTVKYNGVSDWRLVDTDDFLTTTEGWSSYPGYSSSSASAPSRQILGAPINNGYILLAGGNSAFKKHINLTGTSHTQVKVIYTLFILDRFSGSETVQVWSGFGNSLTPNANISGQLIVGNVQIINTGVASSILYAGNGGDATRRVEFVVANASDSIYAIIEGSTSGMFGALGIANVEIWVK